MPVRWTDQKMEFTLNTAHVMIPHRPQWPSTRMYSTHVGYKFPAGTVFTHKGDGVWQYVEPSGANGNLYPD